MASTSRPFRLTAALLTAALSMAGAACGGDDDEDATGTTRAETGDAGGQGEADTEVVIEESQFPDSVEVEAGETIRVVNHDGFTHTFTSGDGGFDEEIPGDGEAEVQAPAEPGDYETVCTLHPTMEMTVTVSA